MSLKCAVRKMVQQCMQLRMCRRMQCAQYSGKDLYISKLCISAEKLQSFVSSFGVKELENKLLFLKVGATTLPNHCQ